MPHSSEHSPTSRDLSAQEADELAAAMQVFATGSRLRLLWAMLDGERTVEELAKRAGMTRTSTSQQLRVLRQARLASVRREGRRAYYRLHDHHLPDLLAAMRHHYEHVHPENELTVPEASRPRRRPAAKS